MWFRRRKRRLPAHERELLDRIETARKALLRSSDEVEYLDFGAGSAETADRDPEQTANGTPVRRRIAEVCRSASKPPEAARVLFDLVRSRRPQMCLELGTCLGISAAYEASALELNGEGFLYSIEGAPPLAMRARALIAQLGLEHRAEIRTGRFLDVLPDLLHEHRFDFAFVDGHHDRRATLEYFDAIRGSMNPGCAILFDDVGWSDGMRDAWREIQTHESVTSAWSQLGMGFVTLA